MQRHLAALLRQPRRALLGASAAAIEQAAARLPARVSRQQLLQAGDSGRGNVRIVTTRKGQREAQSRLQLRLRCQLSSLHASRAITHLSVAWQLSVQHS